ncbi:MAG: hypothetical protein WC529_01975 [Candidatus Margulisiibacteriota bacterium]
MKIALGILTQPLYLVLFLARKIGITAVLVGDSLLGKRPLEAVLVGSLVGWVVLAILVAVVLIAACKFVLENVASGSSLSRLIVILGLYVVMSILLYVFVNFTNLVLHEMG